MDDVQKIKEAAPGRRIRLPGHFVDPVFVVSVDVWEDVANLQVRTADGEPKDATVEIDELRAALAAAVSARRQS